MRRIDPPVGSDHSVAEAKLRRWARENYIPESERHRFSLHPVVLDEMRRLDEERRLNSAAHDFLASRIVPLVPGPVSQIHPAHLLISQPASIVEQARLESQTKQQAEIDE